MIYIYESAYDDVADQNIEVECGYTDNSFDHAFGTHKQIDFEIESAIDENGDEMSQDWINDNIEAIETCFINERG